MGSTESSSSSPPRRVSTQSSQSKKKKQKPYFTWKEPEGNCKVALIHKSRVKLGCSRNTTYPCIAVTNESLSKSDHQSFEWKIILHAALSDKNTSWMRCFIGFMDEEPQSDLSHQILSNKTRAYTDVNKTPEKGQNPHYFSVIYSMPKRVLDQAVTNDIFTFRVDFSRKAVTLSHINGVKPTNKLFPEMETEWLFTGEKIYPAVSKDNGIAEFTIYTKTDPKPSELTRVESQQPVKSLAVKNRMYDLEEKEGFGNKFNDKDHDIEDRKTLIIYKSYRINSPNSITWKIAQETTNYRIDWGVRGSFCGLGIGRRRFIKPETGSYKVLFHFGFIFNGNDYKLTDIDYNSEFGNKHWMVLHLCDSNNIGIELCGSVTAACYSLSEVWRNGEFDGRDYKYYRLDPGFCRKSVVAIGDAINKEKHRKYELCHDRSDWNTTIDLSDYTNCMLFVIRMCKICNMDIPLWKDIISLFDFWEDSNKFAPHWNHFRKHAKP